MQSSGRTIRRIAPGEYRAFCRWGKQYHDPGFQGWRCLLRFDLVSDDLLRVIACVPLWFALGSGDRPRASRRGKYFAAWIRANGGPPVRGDRLSPRVFVHRLARVVIGDTDGPGTLFRGSQNRRMGNGFSRVIQSTSHTVKLGIDYATQIRRLTRIAWQ